MKLRTYSVLVVEDCEDMHEIYRSLLAESDGVRFDLTFAGTVAEGFEALKHATFDSVLLDYRLPDTDGLSFLRRLKVDLKNLVPVILVTGHGDERVAVNVLKAGAEDYLIKSDLTAETLQDSIFGAVRRQRDAMILGEARDILIVKQQNVIDRQKRQLQAFEIEVMGPEDGHEFH